MEKKECGGLEWREHLHGLQNLECSLQSLFIFHLGYPFTQTPRQARKHAPVNTFEHFPYVPRAVLFQVRTRKEFTRKNPSVKEFQFVHQGDRISGGKEKE